MRQQKKQVEALVPMGQLLYLTDCGAAQPVPYERLWEQLPGIPRWLNTLSIWVEGLATATITLFSVYWMYYCMVCV